MWILLLFSDLDHTEIIKVMKFETLTESARCLGVPTMTVRKFYQGQIRPQGALRYCKIYKTLVL